jgi:hypothetical protein
VRPKAFHYRRPVRRKDTCYGQIMEVSNPPASRGRFFLVYTLSAPSREFRFRFLHFLCFLSAPQAAPSSALRYVCSHGLSAATAFACHSCRTRPLLLIVPTPPPWPTAVYIVLLFLLNGLVLHVIAARFLDLNECTTLHRTMSMVR